MITKKVMKTKYSLIALAAAALLAIPLALAAGEPANVTGVTAHPVSATSMGLSWNSSHDSAGGLVNHYRVYYGTVSVQTAGQGDYEHQTDTPNNNTSFTVTGLTAGTTYYFSVTALDSKGLESEAYSLEAHATTSGSAAPASGTPSAATGDTTAPTVAQVAASFKTQVTVTFSEPVKLPASAPQTAFSIAEQVVTANTLAVTGAVLDTTDSKKVNLTTATQKPGVSYIVTAGVGVTDVAGNPIVSGNTDSGLFVGSSSAAPAAVTPPIVMPPAQTTPPATTPPVVAPPVVEPKDCGGDEACFYAQLKTCAPVKMVSVVGQSQTKREVAGPEGANCVLKYEVAGMLDLNNPKTLECKIPTASLGDRVTRVTAKTGKFFTNEAEARQLCTGTELEDFVHSEFTAAPVADTTPPENVTKFTLAFKAEVEKFVIMLRWVASLNSAKDLVDQILYMSMDRGQHYDAGASLGKTVTTHDVPNLEGGKEYTFKLTTKDAAGNESTGVVKSIRLPQTGAAAGLLLLGSLFGAKGLLRKKK